MDRMHKDELKGRAQQLVDDSLLIVEQELAEDRKECSPKGHSRVVLVLNKILSAFGLTVEYITNGQAEDIAELVATKMKPILAQLREEIRKDGFSMQPSKKTKIATGLVVNGKPIALPEWETIRKNWVLLFTVVLFFRIMGIGGCSKMTPAEKQEAISIARKMLLQQGVSATEEQQPRDQNIKVELK